MKNLIKLKHLRYEISMRIIDLESRINKLSTSEKKTLEILRKKEIDLNQKIENIN